MPLWHIHLHSMECTTRKQPKQPRRQRPGQRCLMIDPERWAKVWRVALRQFAGNKSAAVAWMIDRTGE